MGRPLSLKPRLMEIARFIRPGDRVADIGTDHARLPVYLMQQGLCKRVLAADIAEGPLVRARRTLRIHRLTEQIELRVSDGLEAFSPEEIDTIVIAGMGGETIYAIVAAAPWLRAKRLIVQPQTQQLRLRERLANDGYRPAFASAVIEGRRRYLIYGFDPNPDKEEHTLCGELIPF